MFAGFLGRAFSFCSSSMSGIVVTWFDFGVAPIAFHFGITFDFSFEFTVGITTAVRPLDHFGITSLFTKFAFTFFLLF